MSNAEQPDTLNDRIRQALSLALQIPVEDVPHDLTFGDLPQWDSMGHMEVMMRLEEFFGIEINADTIAALTSVTAIRDYLHNQHKAV